MNLSPVDGRKVALAARLGLAAVLLPILFLASLRPSTASEARHAIEVHVSSSGSDENPGTPDRPLRSLEAARDALRTARRSEPHRPARCIIHGGHHERASTFRLGPEDSGTPANPVVYAAAEGDDVVILGGKALAGLAPLSDEAIRARLSPEARGKVLEADLVRLGIADFGRLRSRGFGRPSAPAHLELFSGGKRMTLARWPNEGHVRIALPGSEDLAGDGHGGRLGRLDQGFHYEGDRPERWKDPASVWVHGYWAWDWANTYEAIAECDTAKKLILTRPPHGQYGFRAGQRIYFLNALEELDSPGEYQVDTARGRLYFWPPEEGKLGETMVSVLEDPLVLLEGASHIEFEGLRFEVSRGPGIVIRGGREDLVRDCALRCLGNDAVRIEGGERHGLRGSILEELGDAGAVISGGDRRSLQGAGHFAHGNHVSRLAQWSRCYQPAFLLSGVGLSVTRNLIHDHPHCAILYQGNDILIEGNEIHRVCLDTGDVGAIYTGRDWTARGNVVRHNFIHDTGGVGMGSMGVYLDDCASGQTIVGNVFVRVQRAAFIGGGRDNTVENNIFIDCHPAVQVDGRGLDPSPVWRDMVYKTMKERLDFVRHREPPYSERYPELGSLDAYYAGTAGVPPEGNRIRRNIRSGGEWLELGWHAREDMLDVRDNLVEGNPGFRDAAGLDFTLADGSPARALGFEAIPMSRIGLPREGAGPGRVRSDGGEREANEVRK